MQSWLTIAAGLKNPFDFTAFIEECERQGVKQGFDGTDYAHRLGGTFLLMAEGLPLEQAYVSYLERLSYTPEVLQAEHPDNDTANCCGGNAPPTPSTITQLKSVGLAVGKWLGNGAKVMNKPDRDQRILACEACVRLHNGRCEVCGCYVGIKSWMTTEDCPEGRW